MSVLFLLGLLLAMKNSVLGQDFVPLIVGGTACKVTDYPFMVSIYSRTLCGGTLLTLEWVLTAAHCVEPGVIEDVTTTIRAGYDSPPEYIQIRFLKKAITHENYHPALLNAAQEIRYDIGLVLVDKPFLPSAVVQPVTLPKQGFSKNCTSVKALGVEQSNEKFKDVHPTARPLRCVDMQITDAVNCSKTFPKAVVDDSVICTVDNKGVDTCLGDSGGPLLCDNVTIGIVSFGPEECGMTQETGSYTKIESYLDFISGATKQTEIPTESIVPVGGAYSNKIWKLGFVAVSFCIVYEHIL